MNILVTGANGQLGNEIQVIAKEHPEHIYFFTDVKELDICDRKAILDFVSGNDINLIINCAAFTAVDKAEMPENRMLCDKLNRIAPQYLAEAIKKNGGALIQISTDYVFDGQNYIPYSEEDQTHAASVYGATKLAGEIAAQAACEKVVIIRTAWLYSIFGNNFVKTMLKLGREREELSVVFDQIGTPTYAYDLAKAIFAIVSQWRCSWNLSFL
jgi:dTDP-4-dehydrorhamnose reductase